MNKTILLLILSIFFVGLNAQNNFVVENGDLYWTKTYPTKLTFKEVSANTKISGLIEKPDTEDPLIYGQMVPFNGDYKGAGFSTMNAPFYISNSAVGGAASIKYLSDRVIVYVKRIVLTTQNNAGILGTKGEKTDLREAMLKNNGSVRKNLQSVLIILDYSFNKMFDPLFR